MNGAIDPALERLTERIIGCAFTVSNALGHGFLESVYRNALVIELMAYGLAVAKEKSFAVMYRDQKVGVYLADLVVAEQVVIELKVADSLGTAHAAQLLNYLRASNLPIGLLLNFGKARLEMKRILR